MSFRKHTAPPDYKKFQTEVMDKISGSYCAAKFLNATIWLNSGRTVSCHHPQSHQIDLDEIKDNPAAIHNTKKKKAMRRQMLDGVRPPECSYCWKIEDSNPENVSDRVFKTIIYEDQDIIDTAEGDPYDDWPLRTLEIAFDRTCNFACSYCNSTYSTSWGRDIKANGPYKLETNASSSYENDGSWAQPYEPEANPYTEAFWKWWPTLALTLGELRVTGGEPLMSRDFWTLMDKMKSEGTNGIRLAVNTNLGAKPELIRKLVDYSHTVPDIQLYTSCETVLGHAEYLRDGMDFRQWMTNMELVMSEGKFSHVHIMMTVGALSLFQLTSLFELVFEWRAKYGWFHPVWSLNFLHYPSFMSIHVLPREILDERLRHLELWAAARADKELTVNSGDGKRKALIHEHERQSVLRLIDHIRTVPEPKDIDALRRDFKSFHQQYDARRGKSFSETFPELREWYDGL